MRLIDADALIAEIARLSAIKATVEVVFGRRFECGTWENENGWR